MRIAQGKDYTQIMEMNAALELGGSMHLREDMEMVKAMSSGQGTGPDMTNLDELTDGRAITVENVDPVLKSTAENKRELRFYNLIRTKPIYTVLDQWMAETDHGSNTSGRSYGKFRNEAQFPTTSDTTLERKVDSSKFIRDRRDLNQVMGISQTYVDKHNIINNSAAVTVLTASEVATMFGNSAVVPTEFDGFFIKCINAYNNGFINAIVDCRATGGDSNSQGSQITEPQLDTGSRNINNNYGAASHMVMPNIIKSDIDAILPVGRRTMLPQAQGKVADLMLGLPADGMNSSFAYGGWPDTMNPHFKFIPSVEKFFPSGESPDIVAPTADYPSTAEAPTAPSVVTGVPSADASSKFGAGDAGDYFYRVSAVNADGRSASTAIGSAVTVVAGEIVTLTVTVADSSITGLIVYRSVKGATDASDCRLIQELAIANTAGTNPVVDVNLILPGCSSSILMSNAPDQDAVDYRQLMPFMRMPLAFGLTGTVAWPYLYMLYTYLRTPKMENVSVGGTYHVLFINVRSSESTFDAVV